MTVSQKIDILLESALQNEVRFLLNVNNFDRLKNKNGIDFRHDWYFNDHRIRHIVQKGPGLNYDEWQKIQNSEGSKAVKRKTRLSPQNEKSLDKTANFKLEVDSKRPEVDNQELYLERVKVISKENELYFYTTEAESTEDLQRTKLLTKLPEVTRVTRVGEKSLQDIARDKLKGK